ncbi:MAG: glycosyltransferase family 10, partial [Bacteroidales bacterium]|nr:glycosyltransferase family 10 [Bacteroidales bacterium]
PQNYIDQFGLVCSCQEKTRHKNLKLGPAILPWFVGYNDAPGKPLDAWLDYDKAIKMPMPPQPKTKLISVITSNKAMTQGHIDRIRFVKKLKQHYGDQIDVFGRGFRDFDDKWETLAPYKYQIVIENGQHMHYWTEKLSDCYLAGTFPIYVGCKNVEDYFPREAYEPLDMYQDFDKVVAQIDQIIASERFEQALPALEEARQLVLNKYNMFDYIASLCDTLNPNLPKEQVVIKACKSSADWHNLWAYTIGRSYYKLKFKLLEKIKPINVKL